MDFVLLPFDSTAFRLLLPIALILTLGFAHRSAKNAPCPPATVEGPVTFAVSAQRYAVNLGIPLASLGFVVLLVSTTAVSRVAAAVPDLNDLRGLLLFL